MITPSFGLTATQTVSPKLLLDWTTGSPQTGVDVVRAGTATFVNSSGDLADASADTQRVDWSTGTAQLLVEETRTNGIRNNTMQGAVAGSPGTLPTNWAKSEAVGMAFEVVDTGIENGITYIDIRWFGTASGTTASGLTFETNTGIAALTGQTWSWSTYLKVVAGSVSGISLIRLTWDERSLSSFVTNKTSPNLTLATTGALTTTRQSLVATNNGGATVAYVTPRFILTPTNGATIDVTIRIGLPQMEQGSGATSVIKTAGSQVTRNADLATITGTNFSDWFNAAKGTFRVDFTSIASGNRPAFAVDDDTANEGMIVKTQGNVPTFEVIDGGSPQASVVAGTVTANTAAFAYVSYDVNFFGIARPTARQVDTSGTVPTVDRMRIGSDQAGNFFNGRIQKIQFWD